MQRCPLSLVLLFALLFTALPAAAPPPAAAQPEPIPQVLDWTTDPSTGMVRFQIRWENPDRTQTSHPVTGQMSSQEFGLFTMDFGTIGSFNIPPIPPDSFFDVFFDVPLSALPPKPQEILPGGGPGAPGVRRVAQGTGCPPDDHWDGNVDVVWSGASGAGQVNVHYGSLLLCPGAGASYIHVRGFICNTPTGLPWSFTDLCPGFNATLVNEDFTPAPALLPPGWTGWICLTADATVPVGAQCCPRLIVSCNGQPAEITLCATTCDWSDPPAPVLTVMDWVTDPATGMVRFQLHWTNPDPTQTSASATGMMSSQAFGVFQPDHGPIGSFNVPPIPPSSFFDVFFDVALTDLPPPPQEVLPGGGPGAPGVRGAAQGTGCPPDDHWDGNVDVEWSSNGLPAQVNVHFGSIQVCPGAGASYIHIPYLGCPSPLGVSWTITDLCPGFSATLVNEDFTAAPAMLPTGWTGWICITAGAGVPVDSTCCPKVVFDCDGQPAEITLCARTCDWSNPPAPVLTVADWVTDPATGLVRFQLHWTNPDPTQTSAPATGSMSSQEFGVFRPNFQSIGSFNVPPMAPSSFFDVFFDVALTDLPPPPQEVLPGGGPGAPGVQDAAQGTGCPPDDHWDGNVDVEWSSNGLPAQVNVHYGSILVCPGAGASYIHIPYLGCTSPLGVSWTVTDLCPGFSATLVNEDFTPAPAVLPTGWTGWICITAGAGVPVGTTCCPKVVFDCDGQPAEITLCATTCDWSAPPDPVVNVLDWTTDAATGMVRFQLRWENPSQTQNSNPVSGMMSSQEFGVFRPNFQSIGSFNVPPIPPSSFFDVFYDVSLADLPPPPQEILPGGGPGAPGVMALAQGTNCPPDDHWDGNVDIVWTGAAPGQVNVHFGSILVNPGAGNSYIHIPLLDCPPPNAVTWQIADVCAGFSVNLLNEDFTAAPATLPAGWTGWICISANAGVPSGTQCCPRVIFDCGGEPGEVTLCATTCSWAVLGLPGPDGIPALAIQARPNPTVGATMLSFVAPEAGRARVEVFDMSGGLVRTVFDGDVPAGRGTMAWDGRDERGEALPSGVYFTRFTLGAKSVSQKVLLVK